MKRYLKIFGVAFLAGVGAGRVLIWLNMGIVHLLGNGCGGQGCAVDPACAGRRSDLQHCRDACRQQAL